MSVRTWLTASAVLGAGLALVIATRWLDGGPGRPTIAETVSDGPVGPAIRTPGTPTDNEPASSLVEAKAAANSAANPNRGPASVSAEAPPATEAELHDLVSGIDPLLANANVIMRAPKAGTVAPSVVDLERRFQTEGTDPTWSTSMASRLLSQVSGIRGLQLVNLDAECRATVCRLKLTYPPGTNALEALAQLGPLQTELGFSHAVEAATLDAGASPISLVYLQR